MEGIIFDFNGTLFFDSHKHALAWREYLGKLCDRTVSDEEIQRDVLGRTNSYILTHFLGDSLSGDDVERMGHEKEALYRQKCFEDPSCLHLASGAPELLDRIAASGIPMAIATASEPLNVKFYFENLGLGKWFTESKVIHEDGKMRSKPFPDIYIRAMEVIGIAPSKCVVFEDSVSGLTAAHSAGAGKIFAVNSANNRDMIKVLPGVSEVIDDFRGLDLESIML